MTYDLQSILSKCKHFINSDSFRKRSDYRAAAGKVVSERVAPEAAQELIVALQEQIAGSDIPESLKDLLSDFDISTVASVKEGEHSIFVFNNQSTRFPSLYEEGYPAGILDIGLLYNDGMSARDYVYGTKEFEDGTKARIRSKKEITGTHYIDDAIRVFMDRYAKQFDIKDIKVIR